MIYKYNTAAGIVFHYNRYIYIVYLYIMYSVHVVVSRIVSDHGTNNIA